MAKRCEEWLVGLVESGSNGREAGTAGGRCGTATGGVGKPVDLRWSKSREAEECDPLIQSSLCGPPTFERSVSPSTLSQAACIYHIA